MDRKTLLIMLAVLVGGLAAGCEELSGQGCSNGLADGESYYDGCNTISCENGSIGTTDALCQCLLVGDQSLEHHQSYTETDGCTVCRCVGWADLRCDSSACPAVGADCDSGLAHGESKREGCVDIGCTDGLIWTSDSYCGEEEPTGTGPDEDIAIRRQIWEDFSDFVSCGDVSIYACNPDHTMRLRFHRDLGLVEQVCEHGAGAAADEFTLPCERVVVEVAVGVYLCDGECTSDANPEQRIDEVYTAVAGSGRLEVVPVVSDCNEEYPQARLRLRNVLLTSETSDTEIVLTDVELEGLSVGFVPE